MLTVELGQLQGVDCQHLHLRRRLAIDPAHARMEHAAALHRYRSADEAGARQSPAACDLYCAAAGGRTGGVGHHHQAAHRGAAAVGVAAVGQGQGGGPLRRQPQIARQKAVVGVGVALLTVSTAPPTVSVITRVVLVPES